MARLPATSFAPRCPAPGVKGGKRAMERPDVVHVAHFLCDAQNAEEAGPLALEGVLSEGGLTLHDAPSRPGSS
jgi:hypothetical protein